ncbi:MAG: outer membrane protein assembly factor BamE [Cellvibrionaceae bacterium]
MRLFSTVALLSLVLSGCSSFEFPGVYKLSIPQGNIIEQEQIDQLQPGMSKRQVRFVMGTPILVDTFNDDRWEYVYTLKDTKGNMEQQRMTLIFKADKLSVIEGQWKPESAK